MSWMDVDRAGWSCMELGGAGWRWMELGGVGAWFSNTQKLKAFIIKYQDIIKTYSAQFYSVNLSYKFFYPWFSIINSP